MQVASAARQFLSRIGEDPDREGLVGTPERFAKSLQSLTKGYSEKVEDIISDSILDINGQSCFTVRDIAVQSLCEQHMLPFYGKVGFALSPYVIQILYQTRILVQYCTYTILTSWGNLRSTSFTLCKTHISMSQPWSESSRFPLADYNPRSG